MTDDEASARGSSGMIGGMMVDLSMMETRKNRTRHPGIDGLYLE